MKINKNRLIIGLTLVALMALCTGNAAATDYGSSDSSVNNRSYKQTIIDIENGGMILDLAIGRRAGRAEKLGQLGLSYSREDIGDYNEVLKNSCDEPRYHELKMRYPDAQPTKTGDLVDEYGDYIGPGASYDSDERFHNDTVVMYLVCGLEAGRSEVIGQAFEANYYGNVTQKIDEATFTKTIVQCNEAIQAYNMLLMRHCVGTSYHYDELKIDLFTV